MRMLSQLREANLVGWLIAAALTAAATFCLLADARRLDRLGVCGDPGRRHPDGLPAQSVDARHHGGVAGVPRLSVLWADSHLRRGAVVLVTGAAVWSDAVALFVLLPPAEAG